MTDNLKHLRKLLKDATAEGHTLVCTYGRCAATDYIGQDTKLALEALTACDEMWLTIRDTETKKRIASAFIVFDISADPEEIIADYGGEWMDSWWSKNVSTAALT